jgi:endonuclease YncB( thermonuclease family)
MAQVLRHDRHEKSWPARIVRFRDADTLIADVDLGFGVSITRPVRLVYIESWELDSADRGKALLARDALDKKYAGKLCRLQPTTSAADCYGRVRGRIMLGQENLADLIVRDGHAWHCDRNGNTLDNPVLKETPCAPRS